MSKRMLSARVDEKLIDQMNYICGLLEISQSEFISMAIDEKIKSTVHLKTGGGEIKVPNPQFICSSDEAARKAVAILAEAANELTKVNSSFDFGVHGLVSFVIGRLFTDSEKSRNEFAESIDLYENLDNEK